MTYRVNKPRAGTLRVWTMQPKTVWDSLHRHGALYVDLAQIGRTFHDFPWAYDFMREQMAQRLPCYAGHYPWWARLRPKPDLRCCHPHNCFLPGTRAVRLELAVPAERVLLSNQAAWWCVICPNRIWFNEIDAETPDFESPAVEAAAKDEKWRGELQWPLTEPWQFRVVPSWERLFDLDAATTEWGDDVQATFERLEFADVVAVTEFTARQIHWI